MDELIAPLINDFCNGCLCKNERTLRSYTIQNQVLKSILQVEKLFLCGICQRLVRYVDVFIQNVQRNQIFLENHKNITVASLNTARSQIQTVVNLSCVYQDVIELGEVDDGNVEESVIKIELKDEGPDSDDHMEVEVVGDDTDTSIKEDIIPIKTVINEELPPEEVDLKCDKKLRSGAVIKQISSKNDKFTKKQVEKKEEYRTESINIETIRITKKQCMEEREAQAQDERYLDFPYKCEDCIKGFNFKEAYDRHCEKHSKEMGDYECDICKQRTCSEERLKAHRKFHELRYKCGECGLTRVCRLSVWEHHRAQHSDRCLRHSCPLCPKTFRTIKLMRKHKSYVHSKKERVTCALCLKTYAAKEVLKTHMMRSESEYESYTEDVVPKVVPPPPPPSLSSSQPSRKKRASLSGLSSPAAAASEPKTRKRKLPIALVPSAATLAEATTSSRRHAAELSAGAGADAAATRLRHECETCGARFGVPSLLSQHRVKHSLRRDHYCVECDKSFKTDAMLQRHLKTVSPHVTNNELPLACAHCDKRFSVKRNLERHINCVHLKIKPHQCDMCDRAYACAWSLTQHKRLSHEGYKRPLKYPCTLCDKVFDRNHILKGHMRTHTGERPYQCARCPAQFAQRSALGTHTKLVHLKLTRNGRPKAQAQARGS